MSRVRVRGIYSTALTKLLLDHGFEIIQPSAAIKERFKLSDIDTESNPDLDLYDRLDRQGIYVVGGTTALDTLISILQSSLDDVIVRTRTTHYGTRHSYDLPFLKSMTKAAGEISSSCKRDSIDVEFPAMSKKNLDAMRSSVAPTIEGHHYFKACGGKVSYLLEMAEKMLERDAPRSEVEKLLDESIRAEYPRLNSKIDIEHVKIDGRLFHLNNAQIVKFDEENRVLRLLRTFKGKGVYDGLRIRKDPEDYALTDLRIGDLSFRTSYFSSTGHYKGTYINLNTPVELYPDRIRYVDLEVDVCLWPDGKMEKLDLFKLEEKISEGYISEGLGEIVKKKVEDVMDSTSLESMRKRGRS